MVAPGLAHRGAPSARTPCSRPPCRAAAADAAACPPTAAGTSSPSVTASWTTSASPSRSSRRAGCGSPRRSTRAASSRPSHAARGHAGGAAGQPAQRDGGGRPGDGRRSSPTTAATNGTGLDYARTQRLGRVDVQAVRRARRAAARPAGRARARPSTAGPARPAQRRRGRVRAVRPQAGHDGLQQRRVQHPRPAGRAAGGGRRGPRGRHHRAARRPERGHRAGQQGGQHARAGLGVRDDRRRRGLAPAAPGVVGRRPPTAGCSTRPPPTGERRFPEQVARNVTETMLDVADRDGLALPGGRPVAAKTGTVQSRSGTGRTTTRGWPGSPPSWRPRCGWAPTATRPIRDGERRARQRQDALPGEAWQGFMAEASRRRAPVDAVRSRSGRGAERRRGASEPAARAATRPRRRRGAARHAGSPRAGDRPARGRPAGRRRSRRDGVGHAGTRPTPQHGDPPTAGDRPPPRARTPRAGVDRRSRTTRTSASADAPAAPAPHGRYPRTACRATVDGVDRRRTLCGRVRSSRWSPGCPSGAWCCTCPRSRRPQRGRPDRRRRPRVASARPTPRPDP